MSKEIAKKLIAELQTNAELKAKIAGITDPAEMVKKACRRYERGYGTFRGRSRRRCGGRIVDKRRSEGRARI